MKLKNLFITLGLALAVGIGAGAGLSARRVVKEAKATGVELAAGTNIYIDSGWSGAWINAWVHYTSGGSEYETFTEDALSGKDMIKLKRAATGMTITRSGSKLTGKVWSDSFYENNKGTFQFETGKNFLVSLGYSGANPEQLSGTWGTLKYQIKNFTQDNSIDMNDGYDDGGNHQAFVTTSALAANDTFKLVTNYNGTIPSGNYYGYSVLQSGAGSCKDTLMLDDESDSHNIKVKEASTYEIYLNSSRQVWIQQDSTIAATSFASTFLSKTNTICKDSSLGAGDTNPSALVPVWNAEDDGEDQLVELWNNLSSGAKTVFAAGTANVTITEAKNRYVHIMERYNKTNGTTAQILDEFTGGPSYAGANSVLTPIVNDSNNSLTIAIVAVSTISLITIGSFFFIRKRKEDR